MASLCVRSSLWLVLAMPGIAFAQDGSAETPPAMVDFPSALNAQDIPTPTVSVPVAQAALAKAVGNGSAEDVARFIAAGANPNLSDARGIPLLAVAATRRDDQVAAVITVMIEGGATVDLRDEYQQTPLLYAVRSGLIDPMRALLHYGANPLVTDRAGYSAADYAKSGSRTDMLALLNQYTTSPIQPRQEEARPNPFADLGVTLPDAPQPFPPREGVTLPVAEAPDQVILAPLSPFPPQIDARDANDPGDALETNNVRIPPPPVGVEISASSTPAVMGVEPETMMPALIPPPEPEPSSTEPVQLTELEPVVAEPQPVVARTPPKNVDTRELLKELRQLSFHSCAAEYWTYLRRVGLEVDFSFDQMREQSAAHETLARRAYVSLAENFGAPDSYIGAVEDPSRENIITELAAFPTNAHRRIEGLGRKEDVERKCGDIADAWDFENRETRMRTAPTAPASRQAPSSTPHSGWQIPIR